MNKRKILTLALALCMVAILAVGGTIAYLTDDDSQVNTFTSGIVGINLNEAIVEEGTDKNGTTDCLVDSGERTEEKQNYDLHPNMTVWKDPTITVDDGSEEAYLGAIVTIKGDLSSLIGVENSPYIDITKLASGGENTLIYDGAGSHAIVKNKTGKDMHVFTNTNGAYVIYQLAGDDGKSWTLYIVINDAKAENEQVVLFDTLTIPADYDNDDMTKLDGMEIAVKAYAVQTDGFANAEAGLVEAFNDWKVIAREGE